jgi:hypothetical protein
LRRKEAAQIAQQKKADAFLDGLRSGLSVSGAASAAGIPRRTVYTWRDTDDAFADEWDKALEEGTDLMEDEALRRAVTGTDKPVFHAGQQCGKIREYSDTLMIFMLKARRPEKYRERVDVKSKADVNLTAFESMSVDELREEVRRAMAESG